MNKDDNDVATSNSDHEPYEVANCDCQNCLNSRSVVRESLTSEGYNYEYDWLTPLHFFEILKILISNRR